ncbi:GNAT family N-acetyltransferase [Pelomonas sp. KK5]|uniref:GNAT family N-acetyltransferase n=1 Tax=Pelomonas sp. KK5 TaxID=1855730 RepID=UPI0009FB20FF|nr:GNAT family N-acetyltransferase [Pelomonas sp. KK5]
MNALLAAPPQIARESVALPGGRRVLLRPITPADAMAEQDFVGALSLESRHKRFHTGLHRLPPDLLERFTNVDQREHVALVAEADDGHIVADARYVVNEANPAEAEFAIAVADDWQSLGLGRALMARLAAHAGRAGLSALYGDVLTVNRRMLVLMRGLGATLRPNGQGPHIARVAFELGQA